MSIAPVCVKLASCRRFLRRATIVSAAATAAMFLFALPAQAHITVTPDSVIPGSADVLTFHVPNEEAKADTVKVDVQIPVDHAIAQLLVQPVPGWTISVKTSTLAKPIVTDDGSFSQAVSEVIWSGGQIAPGQFQDFQISADPMPSGEGQVAFKTIQTYSNGDVVRWIDLQQPGQPEPDHPAPVVTLTTATVAAGRTNAAPASAGSGGGFSALGLVGLIVAVVAVLLALIVARQNRRLAATYQPHPAAPAANGRAPAMDAGDQVLAGAQAPAGGKASSPQTAPSNRKASSQQPQRRRRN